MQQLSRATTWVLLIALLLPVQSVWGAGGRLHLWERERWSELAAKALAEYLGATVYMGKLSGNPLTGLTLHDVTLAPPEANPAQAIFSARRIVLKYDLIAVLKGRLELTESISSIVLYQPRLWLDRNSEGQLNISRFMPKPRTPAAPSRFQTPIRVVDGALYYTDQTSLHRSRNLAVQLQGLSGQLEFPRPGRLTTRVEANLASPRARRLSAEITYDTMQQALYVQGEVNQLDLAWLNGLSDMPQILRIRGGQADMSGNLTMFADPQQPRLAVNIHAHTEQAVLQLPQSGNDEFRVTGPLSISLAGLQTTGMQVEHKNAHYRIQGALLDFSHPALDLSITSPDAPLGLVADYFPEISKATGFTVDSATRGRVNLTILGPLNWANVKGQLDIPGVVRGHSKQTGGISLQGLNLQARVIGLASPVITARATTPSVVAPRAVANLTAPGTQPLQLERVRHLSTDLQAAGPHYRLQLQALVPEAVWSDIHFTGGQIKAEVDTKQARIHELTADALGGRITATGAVVMAPEWQLGLQGQVRQADLTRLARLSPQLPEPLAGIADGTFVAAFNPAKGSVVANLQATDVQAGELQAEHLSLNLGANYRHDWQGMGLLTLQQAEVRGVAADYATGQLQLDGNLLQLPQSFVLSPQGTLWAQGQADLGMKTLEGTYQAANLNLAQLASALSADDLSGQAYLSGQATGSWSDPQATAQVIVFQPGYADYHLDALTADLSYQAQHLVTRQLRASQQSAVLAAQGTFGPWQPGHSAADTPLTADFELAGATIEQFARYIPDFPAITGLLEASGKFDGTPEAPQITGIARAYHGEYEDFTADYAEIPFTLDRDLLTVQKLHLRGQGATVAASGHLKLADPYPLDLTLQASGLHLETLPLVVDHKLPVQGQLNLTEAWLQGPVKDLQGQGRLAGQALSWAGEPIDRFTTDLALAEGRLEFDHTRITLAGGELAATGSYGYAQQSAGQIEGQLSVGQMNIKNLLEISTPLAFLWSQGEAEKEADLQRQLASLNLRLEGQIEGQLAVAGTTEMPRTTITMQARNLRLDGRNLPDIEGSTTLEGPDAPDIAVALKQGEALITADGSYIAPDELDLSIGGSGISLVQLQPWLTSDLPYGGRLGLSVVATGHPRAPELMGSVDIESPSLAGIKFDVLTVPLVTVSEGVINMDSLILKRGKQEIFVDGRLPFTWDRPSADDSSPQRPGLLWDQPLNLSGKIEQTELAFFPPLIDEFLRGKAEAAASPPPQPLPAHSAYATIETQGTVNSRLEVKGTLNKPLLEGFFRLADAAIRPAGLTAPLSPVDVDLSLRSTDRGTLVQINNCVGEWDQIKATLTGTASLATFKPDALANNNFDLQLDLSGANQRVVGGTVISDLTGGFKLHTQPSGEQLLTADSLTAAIGQGKLTCTGTARLKSFQLSELARQNYDLTLAADEVKIRYENWLDAFLSGEMKVSSLTGGERAVISGQWLLDRGLLGLPPGGKQGEGLFALSSRFPDPEFKVSVGVGRGLRLRGGGVKAGIEPTAAAIVLTGTPQLPQVTGSLALTEGTTALPRATMQITEFEVSYALKPVNIHHDPVELQLTGEVTGKAETVLRADARSRDDSVRIVMDISGALPDQIEVKTTAEPPLTESQIFALLGGVPFAAATQGAMGDADLTDILSEQFLSTLAAAFRMRVFDPFEDELKRALGLDQLTVHFTYDQPVSIRLGKYLLENLLVTYERSMAEGPDIYDLNVSYLLPLGIRVSYHTDERGEHRVEVGYNLPF